MHVSARLFRVFALVIAVGVSTTACGKYSISNLRSLMAFKEANQLYQRGDFKRAIPVYEKAIAFNPDMGVIYFFLGNSYDNLYKASHKGEPENDANLTKAVEYYQKATEVIKDDDIQGPQIRKLAYEYLIAAYGVDKLADFEKAEPIAAKLIALEPNEPGNYQSIGKLYEDQGRYEEAEARFNKAIEVRPNDPMGYAMLAGFHNRQGNLDKTMEAWEKRAKVEPNNPEAHHTIGGFLYERALKDYTLSAATKKQMVERALEAENTALSLHADYVEALTFKNLLLRLKASMEPDAKKRQALIDEAEKLRDRAIEVQKVQNSSQAASDAAAAKKTGKGK
jgi:tetratricopeptide (TPR) repeat protein